MKLLQYPEVRYGSLPKLEAAQKLLAPRPDLQALEGALDYLEMHLERVEKDYATVQRRGWDFWTVLERLKAKKSFTNTTRALRMIMVFHTKNKFLLNKMAVRIKEKLELGGVLAPHYEYLLRQLALLGSSEAKGDGEE